MQRKRLTDAPTVIATIALAAIITPLTTTAAAAETGGTPAVQSTVPVKVESTASEEAAKTVVLKAGRSAHFALGNIPYGISPMVELYVDGKPAGAEEDAGLPGVSTAYARSVVVTIYVPWAGAIQIEATSHHGTHKLKVLERWEAEG